MVILTVAAVKEGYAPEILSKEIFTIRAGSGSYPDNRVVAITIPLRSLGEDRGRGQSQQQQQQQQQTVVVPGQQRPAAEASGTVVVSANIDGAEVYVDGVFVGNAPATLKLKEGIHIIEVKKHGYQPFKRELRVLANSEVALRAILEQQ